MTPKELQIFYETIEHVAAEFYKRGREDVGAGKSLETKDFKLSAARKMEIKTLLSRQTQKR